MEDEYMEKASSGPFAPTTRNTDEDDEDDRKGSLGRPDQRGRASDERLQLTK
jgi:hypothetical protein